MDSMSSHPLGPRGHHILGTTPLSRETDVQYILSDIPFFAVGIFVFGASTLLLIFRRLNWFTACLHGSVLFAFAGAILDLVQLLARGKHSAAAILDQNPFLGLTITREITYALSFGLRYVFYWGFVGAPPMGSTDTDACDLHSGSWGRWGITGLILQWALVVATLAITALQVAFRIYAPLQQLSAIQDAEGALEACVSAILILKVFLNIYLAALDSYGTIRRLRLFLRYSPVIVALLISAALGVGDVIELLFSETILGRFMQGIELYILVLYMLVDAFRPKTTALSKRRNRSSSFHNMPPVVSRTSEFLLGPPKVPEPKFNPMFGEELPFTATAPAKGPQSWEPSLAGYSLRVSNWFGRRPSKKSAATQPMSEVDWVQDRAERGISPLTTGVDAAPPSTAGPVSTAEPVQSPVVREPTSINIVVSDPVDPVDVASPQAAAVAVPARTPSRASDISRLAPPTPSTQRSSTSPVHGLYGIVNAKRPPSGASTRSASDEDPRAVFDRSARSSGISGLLREQEELDRSIAALKLLSGGADGSRHTSASTDSAALAPRRFSLSVFPAPPWGRASDASTVRALPPPEPARTRQQSVPLSELAPGDADSLLPPSRRGITTASGGTQYEITSFIGHLTHPGHSLQSSISTQASVSSADTGRKTETTLTTIPESGLTPVEGIAGRTKVTLQAPAPSRLPSEASSSKTLGVRTVTVGGKVRPMGLPAGPRLNTSTIPPSVRSTLTSSYTPMPF